MNTPPSGYSLVHITANSEYKASLVASQLFDQAQCQTAIPGTGSLPAPQAVEAWIIGGIKEYTDKGSQAVIKRLQTRCPNVAIRLVGGISRLKSFPIDNILAYHRKKLGKNPVIYHCRGEECVEKVLFLRRRYPQDKIVLDIRGYWPAEALYEKGVTDVATASDADKAIYAKHAAYLSLRIADADAVTTVSHALRQLLIDDHKAPENTFVIPCCVSQTTANDSREAIRKEWGIKPNEKVVVYSGGTAAYQHLNDLTIPFMAELCKADANIKLAFLSTELEKIKKWVMEAGIPEGLVILKSYPQAEVAKALTACDAGILIRKPTLVNRVANPVKVAEYLAAGLPIIMEKGVGGVDNELFKQGLLKEIAIANSIANIPGEAGDTLRWLLQADSANRSRKVREYAQQVYLWSSAILVSRSMYKSALG